MLNLRCENPRPPMSQLGQKRGARTNVPKGRAYTRSLRPSPTSTGGVSPNR